MEKKYYSYNECVRDTKKLVAKVKEYQPDAIIAIARGGLTLGHLISQAMKIRKIYSINSIQYDEMTKLNTSKIFNIPDLTHINKIILIDDIIDSGETMAHILKILTTKYPLCEFKTATIFYKSNALVQPDYSIYEAKQWIDFFWEVDII